MQAFADAPALYLYPLLAGLFLGLLQIAMFFVGSMDVGETVTDMLDGTSIGDWFDWLNFGRVPFSILGMLLLVSFGAAGIFLSNALPFLPAWVFAFAAAPGAVGITKLIGDGVAKLVPRDESYAVTRAHLVGRRGVVTLGPLDDGPPGNVRVRDAHGELHTIRARPADEGAVIGTGTEVVVVAEADTGRVYLVMPFGTEA